MKPKILTALFLASLFFAPFPLPVAQAAGIDTSGGDDLPLGAGGKTFMTIKNGTGFVGIGTQNPQSFLEVSGAGSSNIDVTTTGRILSGADNSGGGTGGFWVSPHQFVGSVDATRIGLYNDGWNLTVQNDGHVGVGLNNTQPQATLDVAGGLKVGADGDCNANKAGMVTWIGATLYLCDGATLKALPTQ